MRRAALLACVALATAGTPAAARAAGEHGAGHGSPEDPAAGKDGHAVTIVNRAFSPARVTALAGDSVTWRNDDLAIHNVSAPGAGIFSGSLTRGQSFSHSFADPGSYPFVCTIHPFMKGGVDVHPALLIAASSSVLAGQTLALEGRAPAEAVVAVEQQPAGAAGFTAVAQLRADAAGRFAVTVSPRTTTAYRAVTARGASPAVTVTVVSRLRVGVTARRRGRITRVRVRAAGAGGAHARLQLYSRERFMWIDRGRRRLDAAGRTTFALRAGLRYHARVVVVDAAGVALGTSRSVKLPR